MPKLPSRLWSRCSVFGPSKNLNFRCSPFCHHTLQRLSPLSWVKAGFGPTTGRPLGGRGLRVRRSVGDLWARPTRGCDPSRPRAAKFGTKKTQKGPMNPLIPPRPARRPSRDRQTTQIQTTSSCPAPPPPVFKQRLLVRDARRALAFFSLPPFPEAGRDDPPVHRRHCRSRRPRHGRRGPRFGRRPAIQQAFAGKTASGFGRHCSGCASLQCAIRTRVFRHPPFSGAKSQLFLVTLGQKRADRKGRRLPKCRFLAPSNKSTAG